MVLRNSCSIRACFIITSMFLFCLTHVTQQYSDTVTANISNADIGSLCVLQRASHLPDITRGYVIFWELIEGYKI